MNLTVGTADILLISPLIALFLFSLLPLIQKVLNNNVEPKPAATLIVSLIGFAVTAGLLILFGGGDQTAFNGQLLFDGLTKWSGLTALFVAAGSLVMMCENPSTKGHQFSELTFLAMSSVLGMLILVAAVNLLTVFIGLELMSLSLYLMIAMSHEQKVSKEAAIKYFILGSFASAIFLYGISFIFGSANTVNVTELMQNAATLVKTDKLFLVGLSFVVLGFCFKVSIAPFHAWTSDVYQGAATPVTSFMATAVKAVSFAAFLRIVATGALTGSQNMFDVLQWLAVITMTVGNVAALLQNNFKRTLAYSAIAHSGYILIGLIAAGISPSSAYSAASVVFYLFAYAVMTMGAFAVASLIEKSENNFLTNEDLSGFAKNQPFLAFSLTVFLLSLAGLPPTIGFFGKLYLFSSAVNDGLLWLALWGLINSVISVYFYLRPIVMMYMRPGDCDVAKETNYGSMVVVVLSLFIVIVVGLFSGPLFELIEASLS